MSTKPPRPPAPAPQPSPPRQPTRDGGYVGNNERGGRVDPIYRVPPPAPRPPGGEKK